MNQKDVPSLGEILELLESRYGDLSLDELRTLAREDGLGEVLDEVEGLLEVHPELLAAYAAGFPGDPDQDGIDVMPPAPRPETLKVELDGEIFFDQKECLKTCAGNCCKSMNYLMISLPDICRIVSSPAARRFGVQSTDDLFRREPPLVHLFFNEEYGLYLPYIRFVPMGADACTRPEDAPGSVCPFLAPIEEVGAYHRKAVPEWAGKQAHGCLLLRHKPKICRLSPVGKSAGLVTGRVVYEYRPPSRDCPACEARVSIRLADYLAAAVLPGEDKLDASFHRILMAERRPLGQDDSRRYNEIMKQLYNIDGLLARYDADQSQRHTIAALIDLAFEASRGNFVPYDDLLQALSRARNGR